MKKIIMPKIIATLIVLLSLFMYGCSSVTPTSPEVNISTSYSGSFQGDGHSVSGKALISSNKTQLVLSAFSSDSGPDLKVWLTTSKSPGSDYKSLGALKGGNDQTYNLPTGVDFGKFNYVLIWCKQFSVLFGSAKLEKTTP